MQYMIWIMMILTCVTSCFQHRDKERFQDNPGYIQYNGLDIQISWGTAILRDSAIYSRVQTPSIQLNITSNSADTITANFILDNMRRDSLPSLSLNRGSISRGSEPQIVNYEIDVLPGENFSITLDNFPNRVNYRFGIVGDIQSNREAGAKIASSAAGLNLDFFIIVGDLVNQPEDSELGWALDFVKEFEVPVYVVVGNHELFNNGYEIYRTSFGKTNYSFEYGNDLFLMLDAADQGISREVFDFARSELTSKAYDNKFIYTHVTPVDQYGARNNGYAGNFHAARFLNLLDEENVDIMFSGHIHSYQEYNVEGVQYYVVGTGGGIQERLDDVECRFLVVEKSDGVVNVEKHDLECPPVVF